MAIFLEMSPDAFSTSFRSLVDNIKDTRAADPAIKALQDTYDHVRRPVRGLQIKDDTYATLQVRTADGQNLPLFDAGGQLVDEKNPIGGRTFRYSNFLIQNTVEQRAEKTQIVQTFGESYIFFYGEQPRTLVVQGVLLNSEDFNWRAEWWENYDQYLRGSACVRTKTRVYLSWDDIVVEGYVLDAQAQETAENRNYVTFSFTMFLTNYSNISDIGDPTFPRSGMEVQLDPFATDTTGEGIGNLQSSTLAVRTLNQADFTSFSLIGALQAGISLAVSFSDEGGGGLGFGLSFAFGGLNLEALLSGRLVRVPVGFAGSEEFNDVQFALQSIAPTGTGNVDLVQGNLDDFEFSLYANIPQKYAPAKYGLIAENLDEFIGRVPQPPDRPVAAPDLFAEQLAEPQEMIDNAKAVFAEFGIDTEPPSEVLVLAARLAFGVVSIGVGAAIV
jgi:hypothetical protein